MVEPVQNLRELVGAGKFDRQKAQDLNAGKIVLAEPINPVVEVTKCAAIAAVPAVLAGMVVAFVGAPVSLAVAAGAACLVAGGVGVYNVRATRRIKYSTLGLELPDMEISRQDEEDKDTREVHPVVQLDHVRILDHQKLVDTIHLQERYKEHPEIQVKTPDFAHEPEYTVKITLKGKNITLAELDYTSWDDPQSFKIEITKKYPKGWQGEQPPISESERQQVLDTLSGMSKFLGKELRHPGDLVADALKVGKPQKVAIGKAPDPVTQTETFWEELADVAISTGKYEIFDGYEKAMITSVETAGLIGSIKANAELQTAKREPFNSVKWRRRLTFVGYTCFGLMVLGVLSFTAVVFAPLIPILAPALAAIPLVVLNAIVTTSTIVGAAGFIGGVVSLVVARIFGVCTSRVKTYEDKAAQAKSKTDEELQVERVRGVQETKKIIESLNEQDRDITAKLSQDEHFKVEELTLNLSGKGVGGSAAIIVGRWLSTSHAKYCRTINLSHNYIGEGGAKSLARSLRETNNVIRTIDISGNVISVDNIDGVMKEFAITLAQNYTITTFKYDTTGVATATIESIERELLVNRFLFNPDINSQEFANVTKYFSGENPAQQLQMAAVAKIKKMSAPLPSLAEFLKRFSDNIQDVLRGESEGYIKTAAAALKNAFIERQISLLFHEEALSSDPRELDKALITYVNMYAAATTKDTLREVDQKIVLKLLQNALVGSETKVESLAIRDPFNSLGLKVLLQLDPQKRINLLTDCFKGCASEKLGEGEARGMAMLVSQAFAIEGFYDPEVQSPEVNELRKCLMMINTLDGPRNKRVTLEYYIHHLEEEKRKGTFKDQVSIEKILQAVYQGQLEGQFACLLPPAFKKPEKGELDALKAYLARNVNLRHFEYPADPGLLDQEVMSAIEETCKRNELLEMLRVLTPPILPSIRQTFLEKFAALQDPGYLLQAEFEHTQLKRLLSLNENFATNDETDVYGMVVALSRLPLSACKVLLEAYFNGQQDSFEKQPVDANKKAMVIVAMITNKNFIEMLRQEVDKHARPKDQRWSERDERFLLTQLENAFNYRNDDSHFVHDDEYFLTILSQNASRVLDVGYDTESGRVYKITETGVGAQRIHAQTHEEVLQAALQAKLERDYHDLLCPPFVQNSDIIDQFFAKLDKDPYLDLRAFDFTGKDGLGAEVKRRIEDKLKRNKLFYDLDYAVLHGKPLGEHEVEYFRDVRTDEELAELKVSVRATYDEGFKLLLQICNQEQGMMVLNDYFKKKSGELSPMQGRIRDLMVHNVSKLQKLVQDGQITTCKNLLELCFGLPKEEAKFKANLVINILSCFSSLSEEDERDISDILKLAIEKDQVSLRKKIMSVEGEVFYQQIWLQAELEARYPCLQGNVPDGLESLKLDLSSNKDLLYFIERSGINPQAAEVIKAKCNENVIAKYVVEQPDLSMFIGRLNQLSSEECRDLIARLKPQSLLKLFKSVDIAKLQMLDYPRELILLEQYFMQVPGKDQENSKAKAKIVVQLLQLLDKEDDPQKIAKIKEIVKYSLNPWTGVRSGISSLLGIVRMRVTDEPYYNLAEIHTQLKEIKLDERPAAQEKEEQDWDLGSLFELGRTKERVALREGDQSSLQAKHESTNKKSSD